MKPDQGAQLLEEGEEGEAEGGGECSQGQVQLRHLGGVGLVQRL